MQFQMHMLVWLCFFLFLFFFSDFCIEWIFLKLSSLMSDYNAKIIFLYAVYALICSVKANVTVAYVICHLAV